MYGNYSVNFHSTQVGADAIKFELFEQVYGTVLPTSREGEVLDLGCGRGEWLEWMKHKGFYELNGVDLSAEELQIAESRGISVHQEHVITFLESCENRYSLIHAKDLIEHLDKNELVELGQATLKALKPGGIFIASTFNAQAPLASTTRYGDFTHEFGFTTSSITQWLYACGFGSVDARGYHSCPSGLKGQVRKVLYRLVARACEFLVTLRHGKNSRTSCLPDLLVVAAKSGSN